MRRSALFATSLLMLANVPALADEARANDRTGFSVGPTVSTLGVGGEAGYRFNEKFGVRGKVQGLDVYDGDGSSNDIDYEYDVKLFTAGAVADYYPFSGGWRLTAGAYYNDNRISANSTDGSSVTVGGTTVPITADTVNGSGHYNRLSPYLGFGYDGRLGRGFELGFDLGVLYQGDAKVNVNSNNPIVPQADIDDVRREVEDGMDNLRFYPVVGINATYRFQ